MTVIILGKRMGDAHPKDAYPDAQLWPVTHVNERYWSFQLEGWDAWWDLHHVERTAFHPGIKAQRPLTWNWYRSLPKGGRPIYLLERHPQVPASVAFPRAQVEAAFRQRDGDGREFTCQVDWMLAYLVLERERLNLERVVLDGIGCPATLAHQYAHRGIRYWIAWLRAIGIEVVVPRYSSYRSPARVYGYEAGKPPRSEYETRS